MKITNKTPATVRFAIRLRDARISQGWTQRELAERIDAHVMTVSAYERGAKVPSLERIDEIARALKTTAAALLV